MDDERTELVPIFVSEVRERLQRIADLLPAIDFDPAATRELKRELHTLKGAGRMMAIDPFAELCHAAEELLLAQPLGSGSLLLAAHDGLAALADALDGSTPLARNQDLLESLEAATAAATDDAASGTALRAVVSGNVASQHPSSVPPAETELRDDALDSFAERGVRMRAAGVAAGQLFARLDELARLAEEGVRDPQPGQVLAVLTASLRIAATRAGALETRLARSGEEQLEAVLALRLAPVRTLFQTLARHARELARTHGREVEVSVEGSDTLLDRRISLELEGALRHLVANAIDHGIEPPAERTGRGKARAGRIELAARSAGRGVEILLADDGRGIDSARLVSRAVAAGLISAAHAGSLSAGEAVKLALLPGLTSRDQATESSGRGVGLDAVDFAVARLGGTVDLVSTPGSGTRIVLDLPAARRGERVLLVRVGGARLAVPAILVRQVVRLSAAQFESRDGERFVVLGGRTIPFIALGRALGGDDDAATLLLEGAVAERTVAFPVERIEGEEEVLVRPLARRVPVSPLIDGAALLASGEPIAVLAPRALIDGADSAERRPAIPMRHAARVLLVDDSLVTREMERRILRDAGFEVELAGDGEEALRRLENEPFDCLVTDIEMPLLDGFALTETLRRTERFVRLPIVVVSTREHAEDKLRGMRAGADAYLAKQSLVAGDLTETVRRLTGS